MLYSRKLVEREHEVDELNILCESLRDEMKGIEVANERLRNLVRTDEANLTKTRAARKEDESKYQKALEEAKRCIPIRCHLR
jgi:chromosome segregation ATPase